MNKIKKNQYGDWPIIGWWASIALACGIAGFVLGWLWDKRQGALAEVRILDVLVAAGTIGAALAATYAGAIALMVSNRGREEKQEEIKVKRYVYMGILSGAYAAAHNDILRLLNSLRQGSKYATLELVRDSAFLPNGIFLSNIENLIYFNAEDSYNFSQIISCLDILKNSSIPDFIYVFSKVGALDSSLNGAGVLRNKTSEEVKEMNRVINRLDGLANKILVHALSIPWLREIIPDGEQLFHSYSKGSSTESPAAPPAPASRPAHQIHP